MPKKQTVEIELKATDRATPVFDRVSSRAQKTKARLQELYAVGSTKTPSSADFAKNLLGSVPSSGVSGALGLSGIARANMASAVSSASMGTTALIQSAVREYSSRLRAASEAIAEASQQRFESLSYGEKSLERMVSQFKNLGLNVDTSSKSMRGLGERIQKTAQDNALRQLGSSAGMTTKEINRLRKELLGIEPAGRSFGAVIKENRFALAAWGLAAASAAKMALDAAVRVDRLNKAYTTIAGSAPAARQQLEQMYEVTNRLGLEFFSTAEASKTFFAATSGTSLEKDSNAIWQSVVTAGTALSLSQVEVEGAFRALGQMVSKGKVMAEELRGQLGEQLPGAFVLAARAMRVTTTELDKMLENGEVLAEDFLPKLAVELQNTYGEAAIQAANGLQQSMNRVHTEWERFKASILDSGGVADALNAISGSIKGFNDFSQRHEERQSIIRSLEARGVQKMGYKREWGGTEIGGFGWQHNIFYTDEQIEEERKRLREAARKIREDQEKSARESSIISKARTAQNSVLGGTLEYQLKDLYQKRETALAAQDTYIALVKEQNGNLEKAYATRAKMVEQFARDEADLRAKHARKNGTEGSETVQRDFAGEELKKLREQQAREAEKAAREEERNLELSAEVMRELEQKTGQYGLAIDYNNQLIERQAELWRKAGVPEEYVAQLVEIRKLESSTDGLDKMRLGWMQFYTESMDWGSQASSVLTGTVDSFSASLAEMAMTGKASFTDLARSAASDLTRIATKMLLVYTIQKALGWAVGAFSVPNATDTAAIANGFSSANPAADMYAGMFHKGGLVGASSGPSRMVPSALFQNAPRFHGGTGYVRPGEFPAILKAGERVLNPAETRAYQNGSRVNLIINNNASGIDVQTSQRENADGSLDIEATIVRVVNQDMNRRGGVINQSMRKTWGQRSIVTKR